MWTHKDPPYKFKSNFDLNLYSAWEFFPIQKICIILRNREALIVHALHAEQVSVNQSGVVDRRQTR